MAEAFRAVMKPLVSAWISILKKAAEHKKRQFGDDARECRRFLDGPYDWLYQDDGSNSSMFRMLGDEALPRPSFRMTCNKVQDVVQLFGPALYSRNPYRKVTPKVLSDYPFDLHMPAGETDPMQQMQAQMQLQQLQQSMAMGQRGREVVADLLQDILNITPNELDLQWHSRMAIDEALVTGLGLLWTETYRPPNSRQMFVGSFFDSVDNLLFDPDMETWRNLLWIARRCVHPRWQVERDYGLKKGTLKGSIESANMQGTVSSSPDYDYFRKRGDTNDLVVYWKIYSRMGMGHHLNRGFDSRVKETSSLLDKFGEHVYLVVCEEYGDGFLNLPPNVNIDDAIERTAWPTPFWKDPTDPWPCTRYLFHESQKRAWPTSHVKPALGELKFMNWTMSFLADKVKNTSRDFIAVLKGVSEDLKANVLGGRDLTLLEFENIHSDIKNVVQFLQHPPFNKDLLSVYEMTNHEWEQRTGLNQLMYGSSKTQLRSATEVEMKSGQMQVRPDDMALQVEAASTLAARKEMIAAYWHYLPEHLVPMIGRERTKLYMESVMQQSLETIVHELEVRIEAGSIRKPNREREIANANMGVQVWQALLTQYATMTGDFGPINWLAEKWADAYDMENGFTMQPPPPQVDDTAAKQAQLELEITQAQHEQKMRHQEESHQLKLTQDVQKNRLKDSLTSGSTVAKLETGLMAELQKHVQSLTQSDDSHRQELVQDQESHDLEMEQTRERGALERSLARVNGSKTA